MSAWLLAHKLAWELAGAANRSKNVLASSGIALSVHQQIITVERCYGLIRAGAPASTFAVAAMPLDDIHARLCAAVNRRLIAEISTTNLDAFLDLALHAGVGVQLLNDGGVAITELNARENSRAAILGATNPTPLVNPSGTSTGPQARTLALHRALLLVEELRRGELEGAPLTAGTGLWSTDPLAPSFNNGTPLANSIWNLVRNNLRLSGGPIDTKGAFGAEASFFGRIADNARLGHMLLGVSVAVARFWSTAGPPTDPAVLADFTLSAIEALGSTSPAATLPDPFIIDGTPDFEAWAAEVQRLARRANWNRAIRGLLHGQPGLEDWADELDGVDLRRARLRPSDFAAYADTENPALVLARRAQATIRRAKIAAPGDEAAMVAALVTANIDSGRQIATMGKERFLQVAASAPNPAGAYAKATFNASAALMLFTNRHPSAQGLGTAPDSALHFAPDSEDPDWDLHTIAHDGATSTTGLIGYAAYEPWRTIFSPLAYLAELLRWVQARGGYTGHLAERRPDLGWIHASEDATFAVVPYLTLALEVLEVAAAQHFDSEYDPFEGPIRTVRRTEDGSDTASYLFSRAYEGTPSLATLRWPLGAPFDLASSRVAAYLDRAGIARWRWMRDLRDIDGDAPTALDVDLAVLGLAPALTAAFTEAIGTSSSTWTGAISNPADLGLVAAFMLHFDVDLDAARALSRCRILHPVGATQRPIAHDGDAWSFDDLRFGAAWTHADLNRVGRILRVAGATGWSVHEVDLALRGRLVDDETPLDIDSSDLSFAAGVSAVAAMIGAPVEAVAGWWAPLDTFGPVHGAVSAYEQRYVRNLPSEVRPGLSSELPAPSGLQLTAARDEVAAASALETFVDHRAAIAGALAISDSDLVALVEDINALETVPADPPMSLGVTLARLSAVARRADLARRLRVSPARLLALLALDGGTEAAFASPWQTFALLERLGVGADHGLSGAALADLVAPIEVSELPAAEKRRHAQALGELRLALRDARRDLLREAARPEAETWDGRVTLALREVVSVAALTTIMNALGVADDYPQTDNGLDLIEAALGPDGFVASDVQGALVVASNDPTERTDILLEAVDQARFVRRARALIADAVDEAMGGGDDLVGFAVAVAGQGGLTLLNALVHADFVGTVTLDDAPAGDPATTISDAAIDRWRGVARVLQFARAGGVDRATLEWLDDTDRSSSGFLRPREIALPTVAGNFVLSRLLDTLAWSATERAFPHPGPALPILHDEDDPETYREGLAARLGYSVAEVGALLNDLGYTPTVGEMAALDTIVRVGRAAAHLRRLGARPAVISAWRSPSPSLDVSDAVVAAVRTGSSAGPRWAEVARVVEGRLWQARRDALVAALRHRTSPPAHPDELFEELLIDPQMSPCGRSSRVREAIATVQLFIQRWMLGLESGPPPLTEDDRGDWRWMRTYRVWEAARRVFLYPENWLRPELRRDKSEPFTRLESSLGSTDLTAESVEQAVVSYLGELHELGALQVVSHYDAVLAGTSTDGDDLHVVARTAAHPPRYFYRSRSSGRWSPWEALDLGLEGDHVMIARHLGRTMLLWPTFEPRPYTSGKGERAVQVPRLAIGWRWSLRGAAGWSKPESTRESVIVAEGIAFADRDYRAVQFRLAQAVRDGLPELVVWYLEAPRIRTGRRINNVQPIAEQFPREPWLVPFRSWAWDNVSDGLVSVRTADQVSPAGSAVHEMWGLVGASALSRDVLPRGPTDEAGNLITVESTSHPFTSNGATHHRPPQVLNFAYDRPFFVSRSGRTWLVELAPPTLPADGVAPAIDGGAATATRRTAKDGLPDGDLNLMNGGSSDVRIDGITDGPSSSTLGSEFVGALDWIYGQSTNAKSDPPPPPLPALHATLFYHPHIGHLIERLRAFGLLRCLSGGASEPALAGLFQQTLDESITAPGLDGATRFEHELDPVAGVLQDFPAETFAFDGGHPLASYNWELFFHLPMLVASRYRQAGAFDEALRWYQAIFDPTVGDPARRWRFGPFAAEAGATEAARFSALVSEEGAAADVAADLRAAIAHWMADPFDAHRAATVRDGAYRRWVVREFLETLIAWGDDLFTRYTAETVSEARQLYVLAGGLLGARPIALAPPEPDDETIVSDLLEADAAGAADAYGAAESWVALDPPAMGLVDGLPSALPGTSDFFGIPFNDHLLRLWDTVADRLFKIRNCLNIDGEAVPLALFDPPIDPAALVGAGGRGADLASALRALGNPLPHHRFSVTWQRAVQITGSVKALGGALLSALEKRDGEALGRLRAEHEVAMQDRMIEVRRMQVAEAEQALAGVEASRAMTSQRLAYYAGLLEAGRNRWEIADIRLREAHLVLNGIIGASTAIIQASKITPEGTAGTAGLGPLLSASIGSEQLSAAGRAALEIADTAMANMGASAALASTHGGYQRRKQDWQQQVDTATLELKQLDAQLKAGQTRLDIARRELDNARLAREHSATSLAFMREKFTNTELYHWMAAELSALYFQTWRLAFDLAMRAEACFRLETAQPTAQFIRPDAWDASKRGLLAGEKLGHDLERMDIAYAEQDRREYELTKVISLADVDGIALERLRHDGFCFFYLPEALFDLDGPGHFLRRIRQVTVSIPCVAGPSAMVHGKLTLLSSKTRRAAARTSGGLPVAATVDARQPESIVTSRGQEDTGTFGGQDGRYQPFEYRGVVDSVWKLELLDREMPTFDHLGITDVSLTIGFTARDGGEVVAAAVRGGLAAALSVTGAGFGGAAEFETSPELTGDPPLVVVSARRDFPDAWHAFLHPDPEATEQTLVLDLAHAALPFGPRAHGAPIGKVDVVVVTALASPAVESEATVGIERNDANVGSTSPNFTAAQFLGQPAASVNAAAPFSATGSMAIRLASATIKKFDPELREDVGDSSENWRFKPGAVQDLLVILRYTVTS